MSNVKLTEIYSVGNGSEKTFSVRQIYINSSHVVCMREEQALKNVPRDRDWETFPTL